MHICGIYKDGPDEPSCKTRRDTRYREDMYGHQGGKGEWDKLGDWHYTLLCIKQILMRTYCIARGTLFRALW